MELKDKVIVVTGAAGGCGAAFCRRFAAEGAVVVASDIDEEGAARTADEISCVSLAADVSVESDIAQLVARTVQNYWTH